MLFEIALAAGAVALGKKLVKDNGGVGGAAEAVVEFLVSQEKSSLSRMESYARSEARKAEKEGDFERAEKYEEASAQYKEKLEDARERLSEIQELRAEREAERLEEMLYLDEDDEN